ncbi:phenylalanine--tRNA ligase subunit beta [candidate division KSB1 bacterium]|nr:phenylalanine--tRNA ligase subunit beta [candidate division KSB1 bacterium]
MRVSFNWLKQYVRFEFAPQDLAHRLTMLGLEVTGVQAVGDDFVFEIDLTPNRPDAMSHLGISREIGALTGQRVKRPEIIPVGMSGETAPLITIHIEDEEDCPRYAARLIKGVTIGPSPQWMQDRLLAVGMRPINNAVDATNYVMLETGQPLHPFDYNRIAGSKIVVRRAHPGEVFVTLDGQARNLDSETLLICDNQKPIAIAGVMGGLDSEVSAETKDVLIESAFFNPKNIHRTSKNLALSTEASQRFERGTDPNGVIYALNRAAELMEELAGGEVVQGTIDKYPKRIEPIRVNLRAARVNQLLGSYLSEGEIGEILQNLEFKIEKSNNLVVEIPTFRPDILREVDLIEEVARIYGYDRIESERTSQIVLFHKPDHRERLSWLVREVLTGLGLFEVVTNSLTDEEARGMVSDFSPAVTIKNPQSRLMSHLRTSLVPGLLRVIARNQHRQQEDIRIFELGRVFHPSENSSPLPQEPTHLSGALTGLSSPRSWVGKSGIISFFHLKGLLEEFFFKILLDNYHFFSYDISELDDRALGIKTDSRLLGYFGHVQRRVLDRFDIEGDVLLFNLYFDEILGLIKWDRVYRPVPQYPFVPRDLSLVVAEKVSAEDLTGLIKEKGGAYLRSVQIVDLYRGEQIPRNKKGLTFSLKFQSQDGTLDDQVVNQIIEDILTDCRTSFNAQLRE